eukprot:1064744-Prymnesium_polylepis.1
MWQTRRCSPGATPPRASSPATTCGGAWARPRPCNTPRAARRTTRARPPRRGGGGCAAPSSGCARR